MNNKKNVYQLNDDKTITQIKKGFDELEEQFPVYTPDIKWFEEKVKQNEQVIRKRLYKELLMFWGVALAIIAIGVVTYLQVPVMFILLQVLVTLMLPAIVYYQHRKRQVIEE
ncbi:hypothetical protein EJF36_18460 [Bacillus sp. HMF5848]|uniref:YxlC family protein n=1 Tax=Bacillus sp. HMF5848 TaxID=2495421 RepID=UPI000F769FB6|nr:YxlC family protein [Bacillus sp. HMF5848]RSK28692.1 hypothetical protein EJF36_18460 [Bacillus sp. HMF5848]